MKYPRLVKEKDCRTDIELELEKEGLTEYGEPLPAVFYSGRCNYQDKAKTIMTTDKKLVQITGSALFAGDICPDLSVISGGTAKIFGVERRILQGSKARNPDGSVNYTEVLLI